MTIEKINNGRKIKWFVFNSKHEAIAGFTTKKMALIAMENYKKDGLK